MSERAVQERAPAAFPLPWHAELVKQLQAAWQANRFPHALLLSGPQGLGKHVFASWLARALLCETGTADLNPCGHCSGCKLVEAGSHPDLLNVEPQEGKQQIAVDQLREAAEKLVMTAYRSGRKVVILDPAHQMSASAANSLLKTLEEPSPGSVLILLTSKPSALLATIRSRCLKVAMRRPANTQALAWLAQAGGQPVTAQLLEFAAGAPLRALTYAAGDFEKLDADMHDSLADLCAGKSDVTQVAGYWAREMLPDRLTWLDIALTALARGEMGGSPELTRFPGRPLPLPTPAAALNITALYALVDRVRELKALLERTALQRELAVEVLLGDFITTFSASAVTSLNR